VRKEDEGVYICETFTLSGQRLPPSYAELVVKREYPRNNRGAKRQRKRHNGAKKRHSKRINNKQ